jgi:hypothetical protein
LFVGVVLLVIMPLWLVLRIIDFVFTKRAERTGLDELTEAMRKRVSPEHQLRVEIGRAHNRIDGLCAEIDRLHKIVERELINQNRGNGKSHSETTIGRWHRAG